MHPAIPICMVFIGCCSNVVFLEYLVRDFPGSGNIITFAQFLFIALEGFIFTTNFGRKTPVIPISIRNIMSGLMGPLYMYVSEFYPSEAIRVYLNMVTMFFVVQVTNNYVLNFNIPMPLHMIFRAGSLIANLILGMIILKRSYKASKYFSVLMVSVGICICTVVSSQSKSNSEAEEDSLDFLWWVIGVSMLTFALFMSARMGIYQETVYTKYGKHPSEAMFYNHALPLPGFVLLAPDIYRHIQLFNQSEPIILPFLEVACPKMWFYLALNVITQYICIRAVFILTTECTSLTVTLVVTLRKFISLLFSILYFKNPFTVYHWVGTCLVFGGTLVFTDAIIKLRDLISGKEKKQ